MAASMPNPAHAMPEHGLICRVCEKQYSKYTCPQCNVRYCSLACYKNHSVRCTESFAYNNVMEEMRGIQVTKESQQNMVEALKRIRFDEDGRSIFDDENPGGEGSEDYDLDDGHETVFSARTLKLIEEGGDISLDDLSVEERNGFLQALGAGEISRLVQPWNPWWLNPRAGTVSITKHGTSLIQPADPSEERSTKQMGAEDLQVTPSEVPAPPSEALDRVRQLIRGDPSPLISVHLAEVIYNYCFTLRFSNGDWQSEPLEAVSILVSASQVLSQGASPESITMALHDPIKTICSPTFRHAGGLKFAIALCGDSSALLRLGRACVVCALADLHRMLESAKKELKAELGSEKQVNLEHAPRSKSGGSDDKNLSCRIAREHGGEGKTFADLRKVRDSKRGLLGNKKGLSAEKVKTTSSSDVSQTIMRAGASRPRSNPNKSSTELKKITAATRKIYFLLCWTNEQHSEVFSYLATLIDAEKDRLLEIDTTGNTGLGMVQKLKAPVASSGPIIEEVVDKRSSP